MDLVISLGLIQMAGPRTTCTWPLSAANLSNRAVARSLMHSDSDKLANTTAVLFVMLCCGQSMTLDIVLADRNESASLMTSPKVDDGNNSTVNGILSSVVKRRATKFGTTPACLLGRFCLNATLAPRTHATCVTVLRCLALRHTLISLRLLPIEQFVSIVVAEMQFVIALRASAVAQDTMACARLCTVPSKDVLHSLLGSGYLSERGVNKASNTSGIAVVATRLALDFG